MRQQTPEQTERKQAQKLVVKQIAAMSDDQRKDLAQRFPVVTVDGHCLSTFNQCFVITQCPSATLVGGFSQWKAHGRTVIKGQHGLAIWCPTAKKNAGDDTKVDTFFILGTVFDVSQTEILAA